MNKALVKLLQKVEDALKEEDEVCQEKEGIKAYWGIDSVTAFTQLVRTHTKEVLQHGMVTADFNTMYTSFSFKDIKDRTGASLDFAWAYWAREHPPDDLCDGAELHLTQGGFVWGQEGYTRDQVMEMFSFSLEHNFTINGGRLRRQKMGMGMGWAPAPQAANLSCYPVERAHAYKADLPRTAAVCRYIDDLWSAGMPFPPSAEYGLGYRQEAQSSSVVYIGVRVYIKETEEKGENMGTKKRIVHTTVNDRQDEYPYHIVRYPFGDTTAAAEQLGGVVMGRLVHAQETCSHMCDFKESVALIFRHAMWRGYSRRLVQSVWSRFLFQRWHTSDIRVKELRAWFSKAWKYLQASGKAPAHPSAVQRRVTLENVANKEE